MYAAWLGEVLLLVLPGSWQLLIMEQRTKSVYMMENILCDMVRKVKLNKCVEVMWNHSILCLCWYGGKQCFVLILLVLFTFLFSEFFIFMNMMFYKSFRVVGCNTPGPGGVLKSGSDTDQQQQQLALMADQDEDMESDFGFIPFTNNPAATGRGPAPPPPSSSASSTKQSAVRCVRCQAAREGVHHIWPTTQDWRVIQETRRI